jgi:hypothetical protein
MKTTCVVVSGNAAAAKPCADVRSAALSFDIRQSFEGSPRVSAAAALTATRLNMPVTLF